MAIEESEYIANTTNELTDSPILQNLINYIRIHILRFTAIIVYMLWLFMMQMWATFSVPGWTFIDGLYWAAASLSTGGMWAIPNNSPPSYFAVAAAFSCMGIPIMAVAFTSMIGLIFHMDNHLSTLLENVNDRVTEAEIELLQRFGIDKKDGFFDKKEFIILCAIRLNILTPSVIQYIVQRFDQLDESCTGRLCYATAFKKYHSLLPNILASEEEVKEDEEGNGSSSSKSKKYKRNVKHVTICEIDSTNNFDNNNLNNNNNTDDNDTNIKPSRTSSQNSIIGTSTDPAKKRGSGLYIDTTEKGHNYDGCIHHTEIITQQHEDDESCIQLFGISSTTLLCRDRSVSIEGGNCEHIDRIVGT